MRRICGSDKVMQVRPHGGVHPPLTSTVMVRAPDLMMKPELYSFQKRGVF